MSHVSFCEQYGVNSERAQTLTPKKIRKLVPKKNASPSPMQLPSQQEFKPQYFHRVSEMRTSQSTLQSICFVAMRGFNQSHSREFRCTSKARLSCSVLHSSNKTPVAYTTSSLHAEPPETVVPARPAKVYCMSERRHQAPNKSEGCDAEHAHRSTSHTQGRNNSKRRAQDSQPRARMSDTRRQQKYMLFGI